MSHMQDGSKVQKTRWKITYQETLSQYLFPTFRNMHFNNMIVDYN